MTLGTVEDLRGPLGILDLAIGEGSCHVLLVEDCFSSEGDPRGAVWVRFDSIGCCSAFHPEAVYRREVQEEGSDAPLAVVSIFSDSRFLQYVREGTWPIENDLRHWRIATVDGTLHVACSRDPDVEAVPPGWSLVRPDVEVPA